VFYVKLNKLLAEAEFDRSVEALCEPYYADGRGRPSLPPGVYFRMLVVGYFEGISSQRGIAWRCSDSLSLREFLGVPLGEESPEHSSLSYIRDRLPVEVHEQVFVKVLAIAHDKKLLRGKTVAIDATTLEANAALRTLVRRDTGEGYEQYLRRLALESGIETPTREQLAKIDKKRKNKASNKDWQHPYDPDARVTKMKDGRTHLAHKAEHAVDLETGAVVAVTLQDADQGDTTTIEQTLTEAAEGLEDAAHEGAHEGAQVEGVREVVADKGYHSNGVLTDLKALEIRSYISEPDHGRRNWKGKEREKTAVYGNRRRIRGERGKGLLRLRGERVERSFAHCYETGGMRRLHLRGRANILKRLLIHVGAFNLSLALRKAAGAGTPRGLADASAASRALRALWEAFGAAWGALGAGLFVWRGRHRTALSVFAPSRPIPPFPIAA
jgi:transposase